MSLALYRKYRPGTLAEVIGQEHVTEPLAQALRSGRVAHAYLFSGPRGCGKTSSARIMARSLNCEQGPTPTPCGVCDSCIALAPNGPGTLDVVEMDAASHGGVDDARDLRERAFYAPVSSRYKVYIIDEAHMVTTQGFNALLKLVEEPPDFLKFVFATTEPDKVLGTIKSRTFHYPFRLVPPPVLREHLAGVCLREGLEVDPLVLPLVVRASGGSVRDALSVLDQLAAGAGAGGLTYDRAVALLGYTDAALLDEVLDALGAGDGAAVFETIDRVVGAGHDPRRFAADLLGRVRDLIVLHAVPDAGAKGLLDVPADQLERMTAQAHALGRAGLARAGDLLAAGLTEMRGATAPRLLLEILCARLLLPETGTDPESVLTRLERLERRFAITGGGAPATAPAGAEGAAPPYEPRREPEPEPQPQPQSQPELRPQPPPEPAAAAHQREEHTARVAPPTARPVSPLEEAVGPLDAAGVRRVWPEVMEAVRARKRTTRALLDDATVTAVEGRHLTLAFQRPPLARQFRSGVNEDVLREALTEILGVAWKVTVTLAGADGPPEGYGALPVGIPGEPRVTAHDTGFDPGDGPAEDDPAEPAAASTRSPEEEAMRLLQTDLGAKVIGHLDPHE